MYMWILSSSKVKYIYFVSVRWSSGYVGTDVISFFKGVRESNYQGEFVFSTEAVLKIIREPENRMLVRHWGVSTPFHLLQREGGLWILAGSSCGHQPEIAEKELKFNGTQVEVSKSSPEEVRIKSQCAWARHLTKGEVI